MAQKSSPTRKLAAIMFTDIAGYTALSAHHEEKALELIETQREILQPIVAEFNGEWLKEIGDGLLLSFPSSKQAVNCAIKIQQVTKETEDLNLRIGIHQGDILEKGGDVFGDDVNIASRIEPFAAVGGVAITHKVQGDISGSPEFTTKYIGQPRLKGVEQQVKVYCITSHGLPEIKLSDVSAKLERKPTAWIKWAISVVVLIVAVIYYVIPKEQEVPSVGILYMENLGSEEDEFWARGITEDVIIEVASAGLIRVAPMKEILEFMESNLPLIDISKKLRVKYLLTSSIYKKEDGFDLRAQLIEAESGKSVYANKWSEPLDSANAITGMLADNILKSLGVSTKKDITKPYTANPEAYEFYLKGKYAYEKRQNVKDLEIARGFLWKAFELDNNLIEAKLNLGLSYRYTGDYDKAMEIYQECLVQSKNLDDKKGIAGSLIGIGDIYETEGNWDKALENYEQALEISHDIDDKLGIGHALKFIGLIYSFKGDYDKELEFYDQSLEIDREIGDKQGVGKSLISIGIVYLFRGNYNKAMDYFEQTLDIFREIGDKKGVGYSLMDIGIIYQRKEDLDKAFQYYEKSLEIRRELGDKMDVAFSHHFIGEALYQIGNYPKASAHFDSARMIWNELENRNQNLWTLSWLTLSELKSGNMGLAKSRAVELEKIMKSTTPYDSDIIIINWNLSQVFSALGDNDKVTKHLQIAYNKVMNRADKFKDPKDQKIFLTKVRENREVVAAWEELNK